MKIYLKNLFLLLFSLIISIAILEKISREYVPNKLVFDWGVPSEGPSHDSIETRIYEVLPDNDPLHYRLKPDSKSDFCTINNLGLRKSTITPKTSKKNILFCGDSIIFGFGLHDNETIPSLLNIKYNKNIHVYNLGIPGYNSEQESILLERISKKVIPSLILVGYYLNDDDDAQIMKIEGRGRKNFWIEYYPTPIVINISSGLDLYLYRNSALFRLINIYLNKFFKKNKLFNNRTDGEISQKLGIQRMKMISEKYGAPLFFFIIPSMENKWTEYKYIDKHKKIKSLLKKYDIEYYDLLDDLSKYKPEKLSFDGTHFTNIGAEIATDIIYKKINKKFHDLILTK